MPLVIREFHPAPSSEELNGEWFILENTGDKAFSTTGCAVMVSKGKGARLKPVGTLDPGFTTAPGEKVRVVTGNPGRKAQGKAPESADIKNYHLFLPAPILPGPGAIVALSLRQLELVRATFDPTAEKGVG